jgi:hypothetical protein
LNVTRKQHYVWRKYLRAWAPQESIWCLRNGKLFRSGLMGVGQEKDFYRIKEMSAEDIKFLRDFCSVQSPGLRKVNLNWIGLFNKIFELKNSMLEGGADADQLEQAMTQASIQLEESFQGAIEQRGVDPLDALLKGDASFYRDISGKTAFVHFLCTQYTRTKAMKERALLKEYRLAVRDPEVIWNAMAHIIATSLGSSLVREQYDLFLLRNNTATPFITGDQPVINVHATAVAPGAPVKDLDLYYPISPSLAVLVALAPPDDSDLTEVDVVRYNALMAHHAHEQLYAANSEDLGPFVSTSLVSDDKTTRGIDS